MNEFSVAAPVFAVILIVHPHTSSGGGVSSDVRAQGQKHPHKAVALSRPTQTNPSEPEEREVGGAQGRATIHVRGSVGGTQGRMASGTRHKP